MIQRTCGYIFQLSFIYKVFMLQSGLCVKAMEELDRILFYTSKIEV